ncbi:ComEC/Rec2 family competence protein [Sphingomonas sp. RIT328]|uniref:ComEC/Rec2 family competence protein n=1 Tax=Sphingomonas sp. RIT328 TaxID=1470591 RepID=UPI00044E5D25|nr:MBL fold metallo-hydrolase [Sphingomonas sp. RIT328]EZP49962.1 hypothetical protein BW41_03287 [Sphingomonas sp. RIT328]
MTTFRLTLLPAGDGDCLVLTWGREGDLHHMVVDGGRAGAYPHLHERLERMALGREPLDLYVMTHIDADHIAGALTYLRAKDRPIEPRDVWFNGRGQMPSTGRRSFKQGDEYSDLLVAAGWTWNRHFEGGVAAVENVRKPIEVAGLKITVLSPTLEGLRRLGAEWDAWFRAQEPKKDRAGTRKAKDLIKPVPDPLILEDLAIDGPTDTETPNGSSIAFLAEWEGRTVLLGGDAHPDVLAASLAALGAGRVRVDLFKASHHGSGKNISRELVEAMECHALAVSTNGNIHGHPDPEAIARFVVHGPQGAKMLHFNYRTDRTSPWGDPASGLRYGFDAKYPEGIEGLIEIDLLRIDGPEAGEAAGPEG